MKPVVGLSPLYNVEQDCLYMRPGYMNVVYACGAVPLILPLKATVADVRQMLSFCDGLILTGGVDLDPRLYGEEPIPECNEPQAMRDELEYKLLDEALEKDMPVLGICRGNQMLNVYLGGSLYQDLPTQLDGSFSHAMKPPYRSTCHKVRLEHDKPLHRLLGIDALPVNSIHHQAIKRLAPALAPMAYSPDDVLEAVWMPEKRFVWGVQWHPEWIWDLDDRQRMIVQHFVDACKACKE